MKKTLLILFAILLVSKAGLSQNHPACDSLVINCCYFNQFGQNTLTIYVSNPSSVLFDYPAFALFDSNMDTVAKETVNYFGIGNGPQPHTLDIVAPLNLPFTGTLNLYVLFYDTVACSFPFTIPDTITSAHQILYDESIKIFPNPVSSQLIIQAGRLSNSKYDVTISGVTGNVLLNLKATNLPLMINMQMFSPGIYFLEMVEPESGYRINQKMILVRK